MGRAEYLNEALAAENVCSACKREGMERQRKRRLGIKKTGYYYYSAMYAIERLPSKRG